MVTKSKTRRFRYKSCDCPLEYTNLKDNLLDYKCLC